MSLSSQMALEDVGALLLGPSFLTADPMGPLLGQYEEEALSPFSSLSSEGRAPPSPPLSFSSSPPSSPSSPPPPPPPATTSHPSSFGGKAGADLLSFPWRFASDLLDIHVGAEDVEDDAFTGMDWMAEKIDLSDFDLDSFIGSCVSEEPPSSPEELLASLENQMDLDHFAPVVPAQPEPLDLGLSLAGLPLELPGKEAQVADMVLEVVQVKSEPPSPAPSPALPLSPAYTLELGSEVDVLDVDKTAPAAVLPQPSGTFESPIDFSPFLVVITPKDEASLLPPTPCPSSSVSSDSESDSGIDSVSDSPPHRSSSPSPSLSSGSSRTKPYSKPSCSSSPSSSTLTPKVKSVSGGAPKVVEKKLKKMEQNKTAATRYRQKKRVEQDVLNLECTDLEKRNRELAEKAESISREIQYLRDLMEEVRSAKNRRAAVKTSAAVASS